MLPLSAKTFGRWPHLSVILVCVKSKCFTTQAFFFFPKSPHELSEQPELVTKSNSLRERLPKCFFEVLWSTSLVHVSAWFVGPGTLATERLPPRACSGSRTPHLANPHVPPSSPGFPEPFCDSLGYRVKLGFTAAQGDVVLGVRP